MLFFCACFYYKGARHFLEATKEKFDLIVFGTLDSQTLLSGVANLRLENYVYTVESLTKARDLLKEGGMVALYYSVFKPWLYGRIYTTIRAAFGDQSKILFSEDPFLFNTLIIAAKDIPTLKDSNENVTRFGNDIPSVDNWPFLYIERPTIAPIYQKLFIFLVLLILLSFFILKRTHASSSLHLNFLFMGVGFTLMESAAIVRLALLFGSTWVVNVIVFSAVLIMIFLANLLVLKDRAPSKFFSWVLLFAAILLNYLFPVSSLASFDPILRVLFSGLLIGLPVFAAAITFSYLFKTQLSTGFALGMNLIGAMAGGMVEYVSMAIGMRGVWLVVFGIYLLAYVATMVKVSDSDPSIA